MTASGAPALLTPELVGLEVVLGLAIVLVALLVSLFAVTMGLALLAHRRDADRDAVRAEVRSDLLDRLGRDDPGWDEWVGGLDPTRRAVVLDVLEAYLEMLTGEDHARLVDLAGVLGLEESARASIDSTDTEARCAGLRQLALLERPVDPAWLLPRITTARVERESAIPVLALEPSNREMAIELLLEGDHLTGFGMKALYQLIEGDANPLIERLDAITSPDLLAQVLLVLAEVPLSDAPTPVEPIIDLLGHEDERIRARACLVLASAGWRADLRERLDLDALLDDEPLVRAAAYRMLGDWRDERSRERLRNALEGETDRRARISLVRSLLDHGRRGDRFVLEAAVEPDGLAWARIDDVARRGHDPLLPL
ncbi:MAG: hypothetical protein ACOC42_02000 [Halobacteriota archaeon]